MPAIYINSTKVAGVPAVPVVQTTGSSTTDVMSQNAVTEALDGKQATLTAGTGISISGGTISNTQTVPTKTSDLTNDSGYITSSYHDSTKYDASNPNGYTSNTGTVTSVAVKMNGSTKGTVTSSGTIDLGTVITAHQDISGKVSISQGTSNVGKPLMVGTDGNLTIFDTIKIAYHNAFPRGKYLGSSISDAQNTAIANRTYDDLFVGDYWTIGGVNYRIVAIDYYYNVGDTNFAVGNVIVVPDTVLYNAAMNDTSTTAGGYANSKMRTTNLAQALTTARNAFGNHVASHRVLMTNASDGSGPTGWAWMDSTGVELMNEVQIYGTRIWGSALKGYDCGTQYHQFPLFAIAPQFVNTRQNYWLQDISSDWPAGNFAYVKGNGDATSTGASASLGVRPAITLKAI